MCFFVNLNRKNPWWGLKKSAGFKKIPPGGGKNNSAWIVHQYSGGKKKNRTVFSSPGRG